MREIAQLGSVLRRLCGAERYHFGLEDGGVFNDFSDMIESRTSFQYLFNTE